MKNLAFKILPAVFILIAGLGLLRAQTDKKIPPLEPKSPAEQEIAAGQVRVYEIKLAAEQFLHLVVDQKSADVALTWLSPDNRKLLEIDNPAITRGPEQIFFLSPVSGAYRLEIKGKETGRLEAKIETLRAALPADRNRLAAASNFIEAERLSAAAKHAEAAVKYEESLLLLSGLAANFDEATALYGLGKAHLALGDKSRSADYFRRALALYQTAGSWDEIFQDLAPLYGFMGGREKTFEYLKDALPLVRALKNQRLEAILLTALGKICDDLNRQEQALDYQAQALARLRETGKRGAEIFNLTEIADGDLSLEDKSKAIGYLNQALLLARGASDRNLEASLLMGLGYIYSSIDDYQNALKYYQQSLPVWRAVPDKNGEAYALNFLGATFFNLGEIAFASDYLEQSRALFRETGDRRAEAQTVTFLGNIASRSGDSEKAFENYQTALRIFRETGDRRGAATALSSLAEIYWFRGERQKAMDFFQDAEAIWRATNFREGEATALLYLGFVYESLGDLARALDCHQRALAIFRLLGMPSGEASALNGIARVAYLRGNPDEALKNIEAARNIIESLRIKIASPELRATYLANYRHIYEFYIDLLMRLNQLRPGQNFDVLALQASERARARSLLDVLSDARAEIRQGADLKLFERERMLQNQLAKKEKELSRAAVQNRAALEKEIRQLSTAYREVQAELKLKSPRYAELTQPQTLSLKQIQQLLDDDTLLLEYWLGAEKSYLWAVSKTAVKTYLLPKRAEIENAARNFYESLKAADETGKANVSAANLSRMIIKPAAEEFGDKRLLIVADGTLQYIPFAALPGLSSKSQDTSQKAQTDSRPQIPDSGLYLIETNEIVNLPSASALAAIREGSNLRPPAPKTVAVLADPVFDAADTRVNRAANNKPSTPGLNPTLAGATRDAGFNNSLPRLPATRREAAAILSFVPEAERKQAIDFEASRAVALSPELASYRIIHFATHGLLNSRQPELSGIVFSLVDEKGSPQDGFLRLNEIYNLRLPADLVVLSACQTALGKEVKGEGLVGLTRGFMFAGAQRVVASLWAVDDRATSALMQSFYQRMLGEKRLRPAAALREAQIEMLRDRRFSAPYFWSAFIIQGEWK